ncbi:MAG TPA: 1-(5-phosphoribosyl)-5-[(5-phosphoribosylamino)methylideneamino]imidazole-4-carboxamide isomerase [Nitrososphaeraceae archaeon]|nr:1-(5-phosphoribosyl)-5-[(5-phosphoribosylamino)methylideneamino]imidazole-4-carboxamide isomerase [Nitrososphaeraceae archaeon]
MKVIPAIDIMCGSVVRLIRGNPANKIVYSNNAIEMAMKWKAAGADMLHVVDLDATLRTGVNNIEIITKLINDVNIPVEVAGGIRSIDAVNEMFGRNAAKVVLGTMAYKEPSSIRWLARKKADKIIISIDQYNDRAMIDGWKESSEFRVDDALKLFLGMGIKEFLLTSIDKDGTLAGPDIATLSHACSFPDAKIIASGGISSLEDTIRVRNAGCTSVILGKALYDGKVSVEKVRVIA